MDPLKIRSYSMLGTHHSWAVTMRFLLAEFIKAGHDIYLKSANGKSLIPQEWYQYLDRTCEQADLDIGYSLPRNFKERFRNNSKLKLAIYNYETSVLPPEWIKLIDLVDYVLPSSNFSKQVFIESGWSEEKCIVVPHGIVLDDFKNQDKFQFNNKKPFRFLNISIPHYRKNIDILVDAYYSAFAGNNDVCLVLKTSLEKPKRGFRFEADVAKQIVEVQKKHQGRALPMIEIIQERYPSMVPIYNSCQALVSASSSEGFGLPLLEGLAANLVVIAPRCTGQLDFLNDQNSLLVDVKKIKADARYQYWKASPEAETYQPVLEDLSAKMLQSYQDYNNLKRQFSSKAEETVKTFTWENAAKKILEIA